MKLVPLRDNPQFLKGFYLRTRFPEVIFEPVLAALVLVVFLALWGPASQAVEAWTILAGLSGAMGLFIAGFLAPVAVGRMALAEVREGTLEFYRASPLAARNHVVGLVAGGGFPEWALAGALLLVFLPSTLAARLPWHLTCAFVLSCAMSSVLLMTASAMVGLYTRDGKKGNGGMLAVVAVGFFAWVMIAGNVSDYLHSIWSHMTGFPLLVAMANSASLRDTGFGVRHSAILLLLQFALQAPVLALCWVNLWRAFRGPRWYNSRKMQAVLVAVYAFFCLVPDGARFWTDVDLCRTGRVWSTSDMTTAQNEQIELWGDRASVMIAGGLVMVLLLGAMIAGSPDQAQAAQGLRRARKAGRKRPSWLNDQALNPPVMSAVTAVILLSLGGLWALGVLRLNTGLVQGILLLCLNLLGTALCYQSVRLGWGPRGQKVFMLWIVISWVVLPLLSRMTFLGMVFSPWLPFSVMLWNDGTYAREGLVRADLPLLLTTLAANLTLTCVFAGVLWTQYRRLRKKLLSG